MILNSSAVSLPGLSKILSGIATLPMSCKGADLAIRLIDSGFSTSRHCPCSQRCVARTRTYSCVRLTWLPVFSSRNSANEIITNSVDSRRRSSCTMRSSSSVLKVAARLRSWSCSDLFSRWVLTRARTMAGLIGLWMKSTAPTSNPRASCSVSLMAVRKITGMCLVFSSCLSCLQTS